MTSGMNNDGDYYKTFFFDHFINHAVRKSFWITPANVLRRMPAAMQEWIYRQFIKHRQNFLDELVSETGTLVVIPARRFGYVVFRLGSRNDFQFMISIASAVESSTHPETLKNLDQRDAQPIYFQPTLHQPLTTAGHPTPMPGELESDALQT